MLELTDVKKSFAEPDGGELPILDIERFHSRPASRWCWSGGAAAARRPCCTSSPGISRPDSGKVRIDDWDITLMTEAECDRFRAEQIGYVFQTFNLLPGFSALENVLLAMRFAGGRPDRARAEALARTRRAGPPHDAQAEPCSRSASSNGWRSPGRWPTGRRLLLADEPTANVDSGHQQQVLDLLRETCREENVALVLVTHTPEVARQFDVDDRGFNLAKQELARMPLQSGGNRGDRE